MVFTIPLFFVTRSPVCPVLSSLPKYSPKTEYGSTKYCKIRNAPYRSITHMYTRERNLFSRRTISYGAADFKGI